LEARTQAFLAEFFDRGQELVRDLIEENEALRSRMRTLEGDRDPNADVVAGLRKQVAELQAECERMRSLAGTVQRESGGYRDRLEELELAHYNLAARQVSAEQLRRSRSLEDVLRSTTEILLNLVGVGRFVIYGIDRVQSVLFPLQLEGRERADEDDPPDVPFSSDSAAAQAVQADVWMPPADLPRSLDQRLWVPLIGGGQAIGVVELVRFLPQKKELTDDDLALLELISAESGAAMDAAWMRAHARDVPFSRSDVEALLG
jgi:hypothetical protein